MVYTDARQRVYAPSDEFRHEALFYAGLDDFVQRTSRFIREGLNNDESILVAVSAQKIQALQDELGQDAGRVHFADMAELGLNPARIIPAWHEFVDANTKVDRGFRGIGEPIWADRPPAELVECQRHESLLNLAFANSGPWVLACPYDTQTLPADVIEEAYRTHPFVNNGSLGPSSIYHGLAEFSTPFDKPLPEPAASPQQLFIAQKSQFFQARRFVAERARAIGLSEERTADLALAVNEVVTNSMRYGGGHASLRMWHEPDRVICEVRDGGGISEPLAGRVRPATSQDGGFGLWLVNQLCDLVQIRVLDGDSVIRMHVLR